MARAHNDDRGWKRGLGAYSAADCGLMSHGKDDGNKPIRDISDKTGVSFDTDWAEVNPAVDKNWRLGPVSSGGHWHSTNGPPKPPSSTKQVSAASPSGKYGKKGGSGQRSGA